MLEHLKAILTTLCISSLQRMVTKVEKNKMDEIWLNPKFLK